MKHFETKFVSLNMNLKKIQNYFKSQLLILFGNILDK